MIPRNKQSHIPPSDRILLRTLTLKSKLKVGKYAEDTVQRLLDRRQYKELQHIYYCYERITFTEDVLDLMKIRPDERIEKPGTNKELFNQIRTKVAYALIGKNAGAIIKNRQKRNARRKLAEAEREEIWSAGKMAWVNQGHKL